MGAGSGDRLARGAHSAVFPPAGTKTKQADWDRMFEDFDPEAFKNKKPETGSGKKEIVRKR